MSPLSKFYWSAYTAFCIVVTLFLYFQGALEGIDIGESIILLISYLLAAFFLHKYVQSNKEKISNWIQ